jgi:hypothetical protein
MKDRRTGGVYGGAQRLLFHQVCERVRCQPTNEYIIYTGGF